MNTKTTLVLAVIAVLVAAYLVLVERPWAPDHDVETLVDQPLFALKREAIDKIELARADDAAKLVFVRVKEEGSDDDTWMMDQPVRSPVVKSQVDTILDAMEETVFLAAYDEDSKDRPSDETTGLDEPVMTVALYEGDDEVARLDVGSPPPTGKGRYARKGDSESVYHVDSDKIDGLATKDADSYRDKTIIRVDEVTGIEVQIDEKTSFKLAKQEDDWTITAPIETGADKTAADGVASQLRSIYVQDWVDGPDAGADTSAFYAARGLEPPRLKVQVEATKKLEGDDTEKPEPYVLLIGGAAKAGTGSKTYYARLEAHPWVFTVNETLRDRMRTSLSDLRDKTLVRVDRAEVSEIRLGPAGRSDRGATLTKQDKGGWTFPDGSACEPTAVDDLLEAVTGLKAEEFVDNPDRVVGLTWDGPRAEVTLVQKTEDEEKPKEVTLLVSQLRDPPMAFVRNVTEKTVTRVREDALAQLLEGPVAYRGREVMKFESDRAKRIEIVQAGGAKVVLAREELPWSMVEPVEAAADAEAVRNLLQDLSSLRAKRVVAPAADRAKYGLDTPAVTLAVHLKPLTAETGAEVVGEIGPQPEPEPAPVVEKSESGTSPPANAAATQPTDNTGGTQRSAKDPANMTPEQLRQEIAKLESLLQYQRDHPDEEKPELTRLIKRNMARFEAALQAASAPAAGSAAHPVPGGAKDEAAPQPSEPAQTTPPPSSEMVIYRLMLSQVDGKTYACREGGEVVYELEDKVFEDATAETHDRRVADFQVADVVEIAFGTGADSARFRKSGDDWEYAAYPDLEIDKEKVTGSLNDFRDLKTRRFVDYAAADLAKYGLAAEVDRVVIKLEDGGTIEILVSKQTVDGEPDKSRYAVLAGSKKVFLLEGEQADKCAKKLEDFEKSAQPSPAGPGAAGRPGRMPGF